MLPVYILNIFFIICISIGYLYFSYINPIDNTNTNINTTLNTTLDTNDNNDNKFIFTINNYCNFTLYFDNIHVFVPINESYVFERKVSNTATSFCPKISIETNKYIHRSGIIFLLKLWNNNTYYIIHQNDGYTLPFKIIPKIESNNSMCPLTDCSKLDLNKCPKNEYLYGKNYDLRIYSNDGRIIACDSPYSFIMKNYNLTVKCKNDHTLCDNIIKKSKYQQYINSHCKYSLNECKRVSKFELTFC